MAAQRVSIGFIGTHVLSVRIQDADLDTLLQKLPDGGWHDLAVEDGSVRLNVGHVLYVKTDRDEHKVGFGSG